MKYSNTCPKCQNKEIAKIEGGVFKSNQRNMLVVGLSTIYMTQYICVCCGFSEEYIVNTSDLEKIRKKYYDPENNNGFV